MVNGIGWKIIAVFGCERANENDGTIIKMNTTNY